MRTYGEVIDVRTAREPSDGPHPEDAGAPAQFLWRGRLYLVRDVLAHWVELGAWWALPRSASPSSGASRAPAPSSGALPDEGGPRSVAADVGAVEREVWRVEAASGRTSVAGVYDLVRDLPAPDPRAPVPPPPRWRLARALD